MLVGQRLARKGDKEGAVEAFFLAFRLDSRNSDAASGLLDFAELVMAANQAASRKAVTRESQCQSTLLLDWDLTDKDFTSSEGVDSPKFRISRRVLAWISIFQKEPYPKCILNLNRATDVKLRVEVGNSKQIVESGNGMKFQSFYLCSQSDLDGHMTVHSV